MRFCTLIAASPPSSSGTASSSRPPCGTNRLTLDELFEELRSQGVTDIRDVKYAILETGGQLSVLLRTAAQPATPRQMNLTCKDDVFLPTVIINDGRLLRDNLRRAGRDETWLQKQLREKGVHAPTQVFLLSVDGRGETICIVKDAVK